MSESRLSLPPGRVLVVHASAAGTLSRLSGDNRSTMSSESVAAGSTVRKGPYTVATAWKYPSTLTLSYDDAGADGSSHSYAPSQDGLHAVSREVFSIFDDFLHQTLTEADTPWIFNSGSDDLAVDPAVNAQAGGALRLTSGDAGTGIAADGSQVVSHVPMTPDKGGLVFEARLKINTAVTGAQVVAGFTDVTTLELPASIGGSDAITTTLSNGCVFVYDVGADTDQWFAVGVSGDTDATGSGATGVAPVADTWVTLRIEVDADGQGARFYINGTLVATLTANAAAAGTNLYATVVVNSTTTASKVVDVDYLYAGHNR